MVPLTLPPVCLCLHPSSPSFKRDPFFLHSFHSFFFQPCGWKCVLRCTRLCCTGMVGCEDGGDWARLWPGKHWVQWGLGSSRGIKGSSEEDCHGKWTYGLCDTAEAAQAVLQWRYKWRHLIYLPSLFYLQSLSYYSVLKMPFTGPLLCVPCAFILSKCFSERFFQLSA